MPQDKSQTQVEAASKAVAEPTVEKQPEPPEKRSGPLQAAHTSASALPPPNGEPPLARAADLLATSEAVPGAPSRARMANSLQRSVGNTRLNRMALQRHGIDRQATRPEAPQELPPSVSSALQSSRGQPLPSSSRGPMEQSFGADFSGVQVHTGRQASQAARDLNATAFTYGQDIFFGEGQFQPGMQAGDKLLAHELTHTIQQGNGADRPQARAAISQPSEPQEQEAEGVAQKMAVATPTQKTDVPAPTPSRPGALMRQQDKSVEIPKDVLPGPVQVNWGGDPFTISFERKKEEGIDYFYFVIRYTGKFPAEGPFVENGIARRAVMIGPAPLNASVVPLPGQRVAVDLYGFRDHIVTLADEVEYDDRSFKKGRRHDLTSKSQGRFASSGSLWVRDPNAKPLEKITAEPPPPAFASAGTPVFIGGISSLDVVLGPYNDQFRITLQSKATSLTSTFPVKAVFGITPLHRGQPVFGLGMEIQVKANPAIYVLKAGSGSLTLDVDGDGKADLQIDDTISEPSPHDGGGPIEYNRNHAVRVSGDNVPAKTFGFKIRYGSVLRGESPAEVDKAATSNAFAVAELTTLKGKTGTFAEQFDGYEIAFMPIRKQAFDEHLITQKTYDAWFALSQAMTRLRPQIEANKQDPEKNKIDSTLQFSAANEATKLYNALAEETKGREKSLPTFSEAGSSSYNPYTGESYHHTTFKTFTRSGPAISVPTDLSFGRWEQAFVNYNVLIGGMDRWIVDRLKETKGKENEMVKRAEAIATMHAALGAIAGKKPLRIPAVFHPDKKFANEGGYQETIPLQLYAWKEGNDWYLRDLTNPSEPYTFPSVSASGTEEPPPRLFNELDDPDHYPVGSIHFEVPGLYGGQIKTTDHLTWKQFFTWLGIGLAVIGLAISAVATAGTTLQVVGAWALAGSAIAGGTAAGIDLIEGAQRGNLTGVRIGLDLVQIVASIAGVSALRSGFVVSGALAAAKEGAPLMGLAAEYAVYMQKVYLFSKGTQLAADTVSLAIISVETAKQLDEIENSHAPREEINRAKLLLLSQLGIAGGLHALAIKGDLPQLGGGRRLTLHFPDNQGPPVATITGMEAPSALRFSQKDVAPTTGDRSMTIQQLADSIKQGWKGTAIDVVETPDGSLVSLDNRRLMAAQIAGVKEVPVAYHSPNEPFPPARAQADEFRLKHNIRRLQDGTLVVGGTQGEIVYPKDFRPSTFGDAAIVRTANQGNIRPGERFPLWGRLEQPAIRSPRSVAPGAKTPTQLGREIGEAAGRSGDLGAMGRKLNELTLPQTQAVEAAEASLWGTGMRPARPVTLPDGSVAVPSAQAGSGQPILLVRPDGSVVRARADLAWEGWTMKVDAVRIE